jgi:hypothetical protein
MMMHYITRKMPSLRHSFKVKSRLIHANNGFTRLRKSYLQGDLIKSLKLSSWQHIHKIKCVRWEEIFWQEPPSLYFVHRVVLRLLSSLDRTEVEAGRTRKIPRKESARARMKWISGVSSRE